MRLFATILILLMAGCATRTEPYLTAAMPEIEDYRSATPFGTTAYDNADLADLFVRLTHGLESGRSRKGLQRFEAPVRVGMVGPGASNYRGFLEDLLAEIRRETGIDITTGPPPHNILVRLVPGEEFLPETTAQCFILFAQPTWSEFTANPGDYVNQATQRLEEIKAAGIMIPDTVEPYKVRECLIEEITQALGTANDLYGLGPTIFNDDDAHTWPTRLDYLMLRVLYDDRLESRMSQVQTKTIARTILDEINPEGIGAPKLSTIRQQSFKSWREKLHGLSFRGEISALQKVRQVADEAREKAPGSAYDCTGATILATISGNAKTQDAADLLEDALQTCRAAHGAEDVRIATLRLARVFQRLDQRQYTLARDEADAILPVFIAHGLEDEIADAHIARLRAAIGMGEARWEETRLPQTRSWTAFVFGADHELTRTLDR